jgi:hypothetical protein
VEGREGEGCRVAKTQTWPVPNVAITLPRMAALPTRRHGVLTWMRLCVGAGVGGRSVQCVVKRRLE